MKSDLIVLLILIGLAMGAGYTSWQEGAIEGLKIGFRMGAMYTQAQQGYNISGFNKEVDTYNAWIQKNFGNDTYLLMQKMPIQGYGIFGDDASSNEGRIMGMPAEAYYTWNPYALEEQTTTTSRIYGGLR